MTIEQLCDCSAAELKAMSDDDLLKHLTPYLTATRPDLSSPSKIHKVDKTKDVVEKLQNREAQGRIDALLAKAKAKFGDELDL